LLYEPKRHEVLADIAWDDRLARDVIGEIVAETDDRYDHHQFWPVHVRDEAKGVLKGLWFGAAGVVWALHYLRECRAAQPRLDCAEAIARVRTKFLAEEDPKVYAGSFLMGEIGILLAQWRITREQPIADRLFKLIAENVAQPTDELMWGTPGTTLAASFMWEWTNEERWRDIFLNKVEELWSRWKYRSEQNSFLWRQRLYQPAPRIFLGPVHGFSGNAFVMMRAASIMKSARREEIYDRIAGAIRSAAHVENGFANWPALAAPPGVNKFWPEDAPRLVQWCHGAPGTLGALSGFPKGRDPEMESLFSAGGELAFASGPLTKGSNLCHGTGGNAILFLKLYQRTGDQKWLERARRFAMHGIEQYRRFKAQYGQGWFSLWTGDLGFAIFLWQCISEESGFPTMDFF
jgi:lantibiotic modifying enzyme